MGPSSRTSRLQSFAVALTLTWMAWVNAPCLSDEERPAKGSSRHPLERLLSEEGSREGPSIEERVQAYARKANLSEEQLVSMLATLIRDARGRPETSVESQRAEGATYVLGALRSQSGMPVLEEVVASSSSRILRGSAIRSIVSIGTNRSFEFAREVVENQEKYSANDRRNVYDVLCYYVGVDPVEPEVPQTVVPEEEVKRRRSMVLSILRNALGNEPDLANLVKLDVLMCRAEPGYRTESGRRLTLLRLAKSEYEGSKQYGAKELKAIPLAPGNR